MKTALLKIGHGICFFLTVVFTAATFHFLGTDFEIFVGIALIDAGPALGMLACRNELNGQRSPKILISLIIWVVIIAFLCLSV